ncbi:SpaA isopeptide-forming pilin-related protein [Actinotignum urinale]|uniref:SpaA isopeptide-forming pilin-related protein n=1 Tax=Actinotignum urinale TaxID=190146 RepID=UPI0003B6FFD7|nr:SpaA isopeptide-forming pilin-related protein [Actinotignum urinale]MDY5159970.1 SpaA isopeptide-forming pilin-related protein [Actinotignum urinale]
MSITRDVRYRIVVSLALLALFASTVFATFGAGVASAQANPQSTGKDISAIVDNASFQLNNNDKTVSADEYAGQFIFSLKHDPAVNGFSIKNGDAVNIGLAPRDVNLDFLRIGNRFDKIKTLKDSASGQLLADVRNQNNVVYLTFKDIDLPFTAKGNVPLYVSSYKAEEYFRSNPGVEQVEFSYDLHVNGKPTGATQTWTLKKALASAPADFSAKKLSSGYTESGNDQPGRGTIYYEIHASTKLRHNNEMVIYDMPDVNLELDDSRSLQVYFTPRAGIKDNQVYSFHKYGLEKCKSYAGAPDCKFASNFQSENADPDKSTEMFLEDVYYITDDPASKVTSRMAGYEEKSLTFPRYNVIDGSNTVASMGTVVAPKNVILEKPAGSTLTEAEQKLIADAGGLHEKVGKGFKLRIKNHRNDSFAKGGNIVLAFHMRVVNDSLTIDQDGNPIYFNAFSYYAQEIPTCNPAIQQNCTPIEMERMDPAQVKASEAKVTAIPPGLVAETDKYQALNFTKQNVAGKPLAGAKFTIFKATATGERAEVAQTEAGVKLENLVTNADGKLCLPGENTPLNIRLLRGNYILEELEAPAGYQISGSGDTLVSVQVTKKEILVTNEVKPTPVPTPDPVPTTPGVTPTPAPTTPIVAQKKPATPGKKLPHTGSAVAPLAAVGVIATLAGSGVLLARRRS